MSTHKTMLVVGGSKGGVGKSIACMGVVDWLHCAKGEQVLLIDGDNTNTDVYKAYDDKLEPNPRTSDLRLREGWLDLADHCEEHPEAHVVINTGAGYIQPILEYAGPTMLDIATELKRHVAMLWVTDGKRDSVQLLRRYVDEMPKAVQDATDLHVLCNDGAEERPSLERYKEKKITADLVKTRGGRTIVVPTLAVRVTTLLQEDRKAIYQVAGDDPEERMPFGTRAEMTRWRNAVANGLETLGLAEG